MPEYDIKEVIRETAKEKTQGENSTIGELEQSKLGSPHLPSQWAHYSNIVFELIYRCDNAEMVNRRLPLR